MRILLVLCLLVWPLATSATVIHVAADGSGDQPNLAAAVAAAGDGDVIQLLPGTFRGEGNRDVLLDREVIIQGLAGDTDACVIDCEGSVGDPHRAFHIQGPFGNTGMNPTLSDLKIINGFAAGSPSRGGAVLVDGSSVEITGCRFEHNRADRGGALGTVTPTGLVDCRDCRFSLNTADDFGAVAFAVNLSTLHFTGCTLLQNSGGGALGIQLGFIRLEGCSVVANTGGACLGYDNGWGGYVLDRTIVAFNAGPSFADSVDLTAQLECCDLFGNTGGDWTSAALAGQVGHDGNFAADPLFCDSAAGDLGLQEGSPCAPFNPPAPACDLIGAWPVGCGGVSTQPASMSRIKGMFRPRGR